MAKQRGFGSATSAPSREAQPHFPSSFSADSPFISPQADAHLASRGVRGHIRYLAPGYHGGKVVAEVHPRFGRTIVVKGASDPATIDREIVGWQETVGTPLGRHLPRMHFSENPLGVIGMAHVPRAVDHREAVAQKRMPLRRARRVHDRYVAYNVQHWITAPSERLRGLGEYSMQRREFGDVSTNLQRVTPILEERLGISPGSLPLAEISYQSPYDRQRHTVRLADMVGRIADFYEQPIPGDFHGNLDLNPKNRLSSARRVLRGLGRRWKIVDLEMFGRIDPAEALAAGMKYGAADQMQVRNFDRRFEEGNGATKLYVVFDVAPNPRAQAMQDYAWRQVASHQDTLGYPGNLAARTAMYFAGKLLHELAYIDRRHNHPGAAIALIAQIDYWIGEHDRLQGIPVGHG